MQRVAAVEFEVAFLGRPGDDEGVEPLVPRVDLWSERKQDKVEVETSELVRGGEVRERRSLVDQLAVGGRMTIPVGGGWRQQLQVLTKTADGVAAEPTLDVLFVPLTRSDRKD